MEELDRDGRVTAVPVLKQVAHYEDVRGAGYGAAWQWRTEEGGLGCSNPPPEIPKISVDSSIA